MSVSKKVGNAVTRNKTRRRVKEIFRTHLTDVPGDLDVVVSARLGAGEASSEDLGQDLRKAFEKFSRS